MVLLSLLLILMIAYGTHWIICALRSPTIIVF